MKSIDEMLPLLETLIKGLSRHFGEKVEFVVHDYSREYAQTIVAIENGHVTGRSIGKGGTNVGLKIMQGEPDNDGRFCYTTQTVDGRQLRSSTIYLKDDDGRLLGTLCINTDITDMVNMRNGLSQMFADLMGVPEEHETDETVVYHDVEDMLYSMIKESLEKIGTPVALMTREQKIEGIRYLQRRGVFSIKNAANIVARYYDVSKYTIYNYLNEGEAKNEE
ncbi:MAG: transcriptional regulator [Clostridia bacterium]|nr:transcriptional regulator [Clostridia bacterium]